MKKSPLVVFTKFLIDFMFFAGIVICIGVPFIFRLAGRYISIFKEYYLPYCILFMIAGVFALAILWSLQRIFQSVIREDAFVRENVVSLKRMGICAFAIAFLMMVRLIFIITPAALVIVIVFIIAGLFAIVLSQVFDQAVTYKQENDLTI